MPTTSVACKLPLGLILRVYEMVDHDELTSGGSYKTVKRAVPVGDPVKVFGPATKFGEAPKTQISGGYALTHNVDADFFALWLAQNADHEAVKRGLIFASEKRNAAQDEAREKKEILSGLEPLNPGKDKRIARPNSPNLSAIETADRK